MIEKKEVSIDEAAEIIKRGGLVSFPTETVYGLGADAFNAQAVARIFEEKERPSFDPLIVHIADKQQWEDFCQTELKELVNRLAEKFWPGPLTLVLPRKNNLPEIVTSGLSTVGVRMPAHPVALELIRKAGTPIAAPSANKFGMLSPTEAAHVLKQLKGVDAVLDGGKTTVGIESTVISLSREGFVMLRPGAITSEELERILPQISAPEGGTGLVSPGLLKSHYSPRKPLYIEGESLIKGEKENAGYIALQKTSEKLPFARIEYLSENGDLKEAAIHLFSALHRLEESNVDFIVAQPVPESGIGIAVMDRLRKAAYQYRNEAE